MCKSECSVVNQPTESIFCRDSSYVVPKGGVYEDEKIILRKNTSSKQYKHLQITLNKKKINKADDKLTKTETERKKAVTECHWTFINMQKKMK